MSRKTREEIIQELRDTGKYHRLKARTLQYQRDEAQKDLMDIAQSIKLKEQTTQYKRDEAQKDLMDMAQSMRLKTQSKLYDDDLSRVVPIIYEIGRMYDLIKDNKPPPSLMPKLKILKNIVIDIRKRLPPKYKYFMTSNQYKKITKIQASELGLILPGVWSPSVLPLVDSLIDKAKGELFIMKLTKLYPDDE